MSVLLSSSPFASLSPIPNCCCCPAHAATTTSTRYGLCVYNNITGQVQTSTHDPGDLLATLPALDLVEMLLVLPDLSA